VNVRDQLPRVFQANADRFYQRVILPVTSQLPTQPSLVTGEACTLDDFLAQCAAQVDNHTANEAAKAFALTLDGMFERQLNRWAAAHGRALKGRDVLREVCARIGDVDMTNNVRELHLVANVVRHGDGGSCSRLKAEAPQLWHSLDFDLVDLVPGPVPDSEELRVGKQDLRRYVRAIVCFWGHVDPLPGAVIDPPY
jgi:hypothetical protein